MAYKVDADDTIILEEIAPQIIAMRFNSIDRDPAINTQQASSFETAILQLYTRNPGMVFHYLVDTTKVSRANFVSVEARRIYKRTYHLPQTGNVAFVGLGPWLKLMTTIFTHVLSRQYSASWFNSEVEALAWLKKERSQGSLGD